MNKPAEKEKDAEDARKVAAFRERQKVEVERLTQSLAAWIDSEDGNAAYYTVASIAMLETALDRYIDLHGVTDALEFIESAFRRRAEKFRQSLQ
jgi:hypothetical protein